MTGVQFCLIPSLALQVEATFFSITIPVIKVMSYLSSLGLILSFNIPLGEKLRNWS